MEFTAEQVWACAAAAQRINDGYFKEPVYQKDDNGFPINFDSPVKTANKVLVKEWLRTGNFSQITAADTAAGKSARDHFKTYTLMVLTGQLNDFQHQAMKIAAKDTFTGRDMFDFAVISCLPEVAQRDQQRTALKREIYASEQLPGAIGDQIVGDITVVKTRYSQEYARFKIDARMGESFVDFWFSKELSVGTNLRIKGKIKNQRGDKTTALNYVKILG